MASVAKVKKPKCKFGAKCYRKNPQHFIEYEHPRDESAAMTESKSLHQQDETAVPTHKHKPSIEETALKHDTNSKRQASNVPEPPQPAKKTKIDSYFKRDVPESQNMMGNVAQCMTETGHTLNTSMDDDNELVQACEHMVSEASSEATTRNTSIESTSHKSPVGNHSLSPASSSSLLAEHGSEAMDVREQIKRNFLVEMPDDFFEFWAFATSVNSKNPSAAFLSTLKLRLVGPYDVLVHRSSSNINKPNYLLHYRYYYDPPEFLTVLKVDDDKSLFHLGYFRDDPKDMPSFVASNSAGVDCSIKPHGENIFAAVNWYIDEVLKGAVDKVKLSALQKQLRSWATNKQISLDLRTPRMKERDKRVVTKCFHGAGLVVPVDKNGVGYRELPESPADLKKILKKIVDSSTDSDRDENFEPLSEIITLVQFANDECDYGEGLELGLDLFSYGSAVLHKTILNLMPLAYQLLNRPEYATVIEAHLGCRQRGANVSQLD